jgi:hypothetical protein
MDFSAAGGGFLYDVNWHYGNCDAYLYNPYAQSPWTWLGANLDEAW